MTKNEILLETIQQNFSAYASIETAHFTMLDLKYVYFQTNLDPETSHQSNLKKTSGDCTSTYRFIYSLYGLTDIPAASQKVMDLTFTGLKNTYCFLDDNIIVSRESMEEHPKLVYQCLKNSTRITSKLTFQNAALPKQKTNG